MRVNLSGVSLKGNEFKYLKKVLKTGILSIGKYTEKFEKMVASFSGRKYGISVSSGTAGLFLLLKNHELRKEDEVITSPFSFIASSNVILHAGGVPKFCDIEEDSLCMSADLLEKMISTEYIKKNKKLVNKKTKKTLRGILSVDIFGNICEYDKIEKLVRGNNLFLIEDSCEALGT
ncbi:MAG: polysaccharide biosynthesis protein, partial [bacterium (Candidatus Stahlbacteria) CG23_combo_of_CG06-09_8_20_14_all_34_7]